MTGAEPKAELPSPHTPHPVQTGGVHVKSRSPVTGTIDKPAKPARDQRFH